MGTGWGQESEARLEPYRPWQMPIARSWRCWAFSRAAPPQPEPAPQPASVPQVMRHDSSSILELDGKEVSVFTPSQPREKWQRKRTHVKLRVRVLGGPGPTLVTPVRPGQSEATAHCCEPPSDEGGRGRSWEEESGARSAPSPPGLAWPGRWPDRSTGRLEPKLRSQTRPRRC